MSTIEVTRGYEGATIPVAGTYVIDPSHSLVAFSARHLMVAKVRGRFDAPAGSFTIADDPLESSVEVTIDPTTVTTGDAKRDEHLRSPDFFDVERFPAVTFASTGVTHVKGNDWRLEGNLTLHGVSRSVTLDLGVVGVEKDPYGNTKVGFEARTTLNREDFGLTWNAALESGGVLVGKEITIELEIEAALQA